MNRYGDLATFLIKSKERSAFSDGFRLFRGYYSPYSCFILYKTSNA